MDEQLFARAVALLAATMELRGQENDPGYQERLEQHADLNARYIVVGTF